MTENPYRLARDIRGIGFKTADAIAMKLGIEKTAMIRVRAGISYALTETPCAFVELREGRSATSGRRPDNSVSRQQGDDNNRRSFQHSALPRPMSCLGRDFNQLGRQAIADLFLCREWRR